MNDETKAQIRAEMDRPLTKDGVGLRFFMIELVEFTHRRDQANADGSFDIDRVAYDPENPGGTINEVEHCPDIDAVLASLEVEL